MGVSTFLSGILFSIGIRAVFLSSMFLFIITIIMIIFYFKPIEQKRKTKRIPSEKSEEMKNH